MKWIGLLAGVLIVLPCSGQASISGRVLGPDGLVQNVKVVVFDVGSHRKVKVIKTPTGEFGPVPLALGRYKVEVRKRCFKQYSEEVTLSEDKPLWLPIGLYKTCGPPSLFE
jgi:hypothetical protein